MTTKFNILTGMFCLVSMSIAYGQVSVSAASESTIEGTPYLDEAFAPGEIYSGNTIRKVPVRYNIFQDVMEYKQNGQALVLDANSGVKKIKIGAATFVVQKFEVKGKVKNGFFALLDSGKVTLYSKRVVTFLEAKTGGALDGSNTPARYTRSADVFYYRITGGELREVENIKSMIANFPDKQDDLAMYAKKEKISPRKEKTLIQLVQYYNSL